MKFTILFLISFPAFASHFVGDFKSYGQKGDEISVRFAGREKTFTVPADSKTAPCLYDGWLAKMPVAIEVNDETGAMTGCKLSSRTLPGAQRSN